MYVIWKKMKILCVCFLYFSIKVTVHPQMKILSSFTHNYVFPNLYEIFLLDLTGIHNVQKKLKHPLKYLLYSVVVIQVCKIEQKWTFFPFGIEPFQTKQNCMVSFPLFFCLSRAGRCLTVWSADCMSPPTSSNLIKACSSSLSSNNLLFTLLSLPFSFSFPHSRSSLYPVY